MENPIFEIEQGLKYIYIGVSEDGAIISTDDIDTYQIIIVTAFASHEVVATKRDGYFCLAVPRRYYGWAVFRVIVNCHHTEFGDLTFTTENGSKWVKSSDGKNAVLIVGGAEGEIVIPDTPGHIDDEPTEGSRNLVRSGGVWSKLQELWSRIVNADWFENDSTSGSYIRNRTHYYTGVATAVVAAITRDSGRSAHGIYQTGTDTSVLDIDGKIHPIEITLGNVTQLAFYQYVGTGRFAFGSYRYLVTETVADDVCCGTLTPEGGANTFNCTLPVGYEDAYYQLTINAVNVKQLSEAYAQEIVSQLSGCVTGATYNSNRKKIVLTGLDSMTIAEIDTTLFENENIKVITAEATLSPSFELTISNYSNVYASVLAANTAGKIPMLRITTNVSVIIDAVLSEVGAGTFFGASQFMSSQMATLRMLSDRYDFNIVEYQGKLVSGTNIKTIDGTPLLGSGDIVIGVKEISASGTITGTFPNITIAINDYASVYADLVDASTQGKVPVVRMRLTQGSNVYEYSGIASSHNGWQFVGTFQMQGNYVSYNVFNRPTDTVPYEIDVVRLQEQLVSGTNIKTINSGSVLGSGDIEVMVDTEVIECNVTSVDSSGVATVNNTNWFTQAVAAYNNHKLPIVNGTYNYAKFAVQLTVVEGSPYNNCYGSTAVTKYIGSGQVRMFAINFMATGNSPLVYVHDLQQQLTFDNTPTQNSDNPVKSGGVYSALAGKQDTLTFDSAPLENSTKPVYGGGIYSALKFKEDIPPIVDMTDSYSTETLTASVNTSNGLCTLSADPSDWAGDSDLSLGYTNPTTNKKEYRIVQYDYSNKQFTLPAYALGTSGTETISVTFYPRSIVSISGNYKAGRLYTFDTIVDTFSSITLAAGEIATVANHYMIQFYYPPKDAGSSVTVSFNTSAAFPDGVKWMYGEPTFKPDNTYLVHFMNGLAWAETTEDILGDINTILDVINGEVI